MNNSTPPDLPAPATKPARRAHRTREQWAELIALHSESGLDVARFCEQHDVGVAGFYAWRRRLAEPAAAGDHTNAEPPRFVRLAATPDPSDELTAHFPGDVRLTLPASVVRPPYSYNPDGYSPQVFMRPALLRGPHENLLAFCT